MLDYRGVTNLTITSSRTPISLGSKMLVRSGLDVDLLVLPWIYGCELWTGHGRWDRWGVNGGDCMGIIAGQIFFGI